MRRIITSGGKQYYFKDAFLYKGKATEYKQELEDMGYSAIVRNIPEGWGVYYR